MTTSNSISSHTSADTSGYVITGASSGIGLAISNMLLDNDYHVIGIARSIADRKIKHRDKLQALTMDFTDINATIKNIEILKSSITELKGIICCAGFGKFGSLEK